ncbi:MAG: hypothetical protein KKC68_03990, partial [Candidatus Thermoplasmatota archaeon]|nr:hypothetical protein [Candidatus Thermoplasmatota archaeon]
AKEMQEDVSFHYGLRIVLFISLFNIVIFPLTLPALLYGDYVLLSLTIISILLFITLPFFIEILLIRASTSILKCRLRYDFIFSLLAAPFMGLSFIQVLFILITVKVSMPIYYIYIVLIILKPTYTFIYLRELTKNQFHSFIAALSVLIIDIPLYSFQIIAQTF